jgi:hypothetical protein
MPTKRKEYQRFAVLAKDSGKVLKLKNMRYGFKPTLDPARYDAIALKDADTVEPGMVRDGEGFGWPK